MTSPSPDLVERLRATANDHRHNITPAVRALLLDAFEALTAQQQEPVGEAEVFAYLDSNGMPHPPFRYPKEWRENHEQHGLTPLVLQADHQRAIAERDAEIARLENDNEVLTYKLEQAVSTIQPMIISRAEAAKARLSTLEAHLAEARAFIEDNGLVTNFEAYLASSAALNKGGGAG